MVNLATQKLTLHNKELDILKYEVWWHVDGLGLFTDIRSAMQSIQEPNLINCRPVTVAIDSQGRYEAL